MNLQPVHKAQQMAGVTEYALRKAIREGKVQVLKWGNRQLVDVDAVREALDERIAMEGYLTTAELSKETGLGAGTIRRMANEGLLPCERFGGVYYFDKDEVMKAIAERMALDSQIE